MRGRYYLKHTINHIVSSRGNNVYAKEDILGNVYYYENYFAKNPDMLIMDKINILRNNLKSGEANILLIKLKDEELCMTYCGKTTEEVKSELTKHTMGCLYLSVGFIIIIICIVVKLI